MRVHLRASYVAISFLCFAHALGAEQVVVYSSMPEDAGRPVVERFEEETNTTVKLVLGTGRSTSTELLDQLAKNKKQPQPDVFWSRDPEGAVILKSKGLSTPYESPNAKDVPALYSDPEHHWTGFPSHARVIIYNKNLLADPEAVPTSIFDMMNPRFNGRGCIANPLFGMSSFHAAALFQVLGRDMAEALFNSLKVNKITMLSSDSEVRVRVAVGDFAFGIADSEDFNLAVRRGQPIGVAFPDQQAFGTFVVPSVLVLLVNGSNREQGKRFIDFVLRADTQKLLGASRGIATLDSIKPMEVDYGKLKSQSQELSHGFLKEWADKR